MSAQLSVADIKSATGGIVLKQVETQFVGVGTDSRVALGGKLFIPLKGDKFDGHQFVSDAIKRGAKGVLVAKDTSKGLIDMILENNVTVIQVEDTLKGLQDLANFWRHKFKAMVIAITGSNGKTTTKEFAAAILGTKYRVKASPESFNNHIGVPLSLLSVSMEDEVAIVEMGMNHKGELTRLCQIAEPDFAMVTNVGRAHVGQLGTIADVAEAKEEIYKNSPNAFHIFNIDNEYTIKMFETYKSSDKNQITFSVFNESANVQMRMNLMRLDSFEVKGQINKVPGQANLAVFGRQNINNIMAASAIALAVGMSPEDIWHALPLCRCNWGRNQLIKLKSGAQVIFDAYNANPESMMAMIRNMYELTIKGKKYAVIGEMLELGTDSDALHKEIAEALGNTDVEAIWYIGSKGSAFEAGLKLSRFEKSYYISNTYEQTLAIKFASMLNEEDIAIIKGSRGIKLERVLQAWEPVNF